MITLTVGTNSWISIAQADTYFEEKYGASAWASLTDDQKKQLLITAFRWLNQQAEYSIPATATSDSVKFAQCEAAWYIKGFWEQHEERMALYASGVRDFTVSKFSETLEAAMVPLHITGMLSDYLVDIGGFLPTVERDFE